ncbi:MAG TPA: MauE/DoxX family redox-associated membrane protein [Candidatus Acidoferrales bacterium]|nr:MauE/DoxX family redox-associated membrane protein [Candidatus Acidoferrales bacterium]
MEQTSRQKTGKILLTIGRIVLAGIFLAAAFGKLKPLAGMPWTVASVKTSLAMFAMGVDSFQILPAWAVSPLAHFLPFFEIVLAIWLLSGFALRVSSLLSTLAICVFIYAMFSAWHRGLAINCGCFGQGGAPIGLWDLTRDAVLFLPLSLAIFIGSIFMRRSKRVESATPVAQHTTA